jgi:hypothetical protein
MVGDKAAVSVVLRAQPASAMIASRPKKRREEFITDSEV